MICSKLFCINKKKMFFRIRHILAHVMIRRIRIKICEAVCICIDIESNHGKGRKLSAAWDKFEYGMRRNRNKKDKDFKILIDH